MCGVWKQYLEPVLLGQIRLVWGNAPAKHEQQVGRVRGLVKKQPYTFLKDRGVRPIPISQTMPKKTRFPWQR